ncbi:21232_t:CDS:2 [Entrophospora sp. SA101]|nr:21232_t:CDS:2 [Entrophospora sp. SA101]
MVMTPGFIGIQQQHFVLECLAITFFKLQLRDLGFFSFGLFNPGILEELRKKITIIAIYGINALRMNDKNKVKIFSIIYWLSVVLLLVLHLVQLILAFKWKDDTMYNCQDDIRYWVPSNSSTVTMPDDPNATTIQEVGDACEAATKLALIFYLVDYFLKFIFLIHFGRVVHSYSKVLFEEKIDNGEDREIEKIDLEDDDEKKDKQKNDIK